MSVEYENNDGQAGGVDAAGGGEGNGEGAPDFGGNGENTDFVVSEPKKQLNTTTLVLFGVMALGGGALYLMRGGPSTASANTSAASATVEQFLNGGPGNVAQMQRMLNETQQVVDQFLTYPRVTQIPLKSLSTNPFRQMLPTDNADGVSDAEAKRRKEEERLAIKTAADELRLQSVIAMGARSTCMINNTMYKEGQQMDGGFVVDKITASAVLVHNGPYKFELKMQR